MAVQEKVEMRHPGVAVSAWVPRSAVPIHEKRGWKPVEQKTTGARRRTEKSGEAS